jgi:signal transduction histidine kinase
VVEPAILFSGVCLYSVLRLLTPFNWQKQGASRIILISLDMVVGVSLLTLTGGLYSPYLLYTLCGVLVAALVMDARTTGAIALVSGIYVISSHALNPFFNIQLSNIEVAYSTIYLISVFLTPVLPFMTNLNLRKRMQTETILEERQRLSREIHDGSVQTLTALRWQIQLLNRNLARQGLKLGEATHLEELIEKYRQDAVMTLELLRENNQKGDIVTKLEESLKLLEPGIHTEFSLKGDKIKLNPR